MDYWAHTRGRNCRFGLWPLLIYQPASYEELKGWICWPNMWAVVFRSQGVLPVNRETTEAKLLLVWRFGNTEIEIGSSSRLPRQNCANRINWAFNLPHFSWENSRALWPRERQASRSISIYSRKTKTSTCLVNLDISSPVGESATNSIYKLYWTESLCTRQERWVTTKVFGSFHRVHREIAAVLVNYFGNLQRQERECLVGHPF